MLRAAGKYNQPQHRRRGAETGWEKPDLPTEHTVSQCDFGRVWTVGTVKPTNRGAEEIQHLRPNNMGRRGRINQVQLWSERLERRTWSMPENPDEARTRRKCGDLVKETVQPRTKGMHRSHGKS